MKPTPCALAVALAALVLAASHLMAAPPDLTAGGTPNNTRTANLGPTGMRGWIYHVNGGGRTADTSESRQILVNAVDIGSPTHGVLAANDVILGASGTGANPVPFSSDARKSLALAIADAEARNPATLKLLRWRSETTTTVEITLRTMGAYSATAPYDCPKSSLILAEGAEWVFNNETSGRYRFGAMSLLATGNPTYATWVRNEARALVPNATTRARMMSDTRDASSMITWERGHTLVFLAEYYLATGDAEVLPGIEAYAVNIAKNSSLFGTVGHIFADKFSDGSPNGPMGGVYGPVNSSAMPCFLGLLLARECGLMNPEIEPAIDRASLFFSSYAGRGAIPYGEHEPVSSHEGNGRSGLAAVAFALQENRAEAGRFFAKMATAAPTERENGHTGAFFNYLWSPLGAATGGEAAAAEHFKRISWHLDLSRRWNGAFVYDCLNGEGPNSGATYNNFRMSTAALLVYALPLRHLHITGRGHNPDRWLSAADLADAINAVDYHLPSRTTAQLISDTGSWSPKIRRQAAIELRARGVTTAQREELQAIAVDSNLPAHARAGACEALGRIANSASAPVLASLLNDPENHVRHASAEGLRYLPNTARQSVLEQVLVATAETAKPWYPIDEEDPLQFANGRLAVLLFYGGSAYGPRGIIWNNLSGVDRDLLYPAIRAVAGSPLGFTRNNLQWTYPMLTRDEFLAVSGAVVDAVSEFAPADRMFAFSVRQRGFEMMEKFNIAEGVPTGLKYTVETKAGDRTAALRILERYAASYTTITPEPDVIGGVTPFLNPTDGNAAQKESVSLAAQDVLDAIEADTNPRTLIPLKAIQSVVADVPLLNLPNNSTLLHVTAYDHAQGDSVFTWTKISGPGDVTFSPNGTAAAATSTVHFDGISGTYEFEVTMSDSRGLTEVSSTVTVELVDDPLSMEVTRSGSTIAVGGVDGVVGASVGSGTQLTYTISNIGGEQLELTTPVTISDPQNCSVTVNTQPTSPVGKGGSTSLVTTITPTSAGTWSFNVSIANNDPDKNPYYWLVTGITGASATVSFTPVADNYIHDQSPGTNYGTEPRIYLNNRTGGNPSTRAVLRGLLHFDLSSIPSGSTIESATLDFVQDNGNSGLVEIVEATGSWGETTATWTNGNEIYGATSFGSANTGTTAGGAVPTITLNSDGLSKVQSWVNDSSGNHGFGITTNNDGSGQNNWLAIRSREHATAAHHPRLTVTYAGGSAEAPLMIVSGSDGVIGNGGSVAIPEIQTGVGTQLSYTISNLGNIDLTMTTPVAASLVSNCAISVNTQPASQIAPSGTTELVLTVTPSSAGIWSATISIANNDADKNPYTWTVSGSAFTIHSVTYDGNNSDNGAAPVDASSPYLDGTTVTVLGNTGNLTKAGYAFGGWNTAGNGNGTHHAPDDTFIINAPTMLYAQWTPVGVLAVAPGGDLVSSGLVGGPFTPSNQQYTLQNAGTAELDWTVTKSAPWLSLSATSGTLLPGESAIVTISINSNAEALSMNAYSDTISFTNTTNGNGDTTREVSLSVIGLGPYASGGTITEAGGYYIHTFTQGGADTFQVIGDGTLEVDILVVGGGGGGGSSTAFGMAGGGGGGAGGLIYQTGLPVSGATDILVGTQGAAGGTGNIPGSNGGNSSFGSLVALGGGGGSGGNMQGLAGGSGGGSRGNANGGAAQQPGSASGGLGNVGGGWTATGGHAAGGGGGAGNAAPSSPPADPLIGGTGGIGLTSDISGTQIHYAGGGGGGGSTTSPFGPGGLGGGGNGGNNDTAPTSGAPNTGGGGGGGNNNRTGADGGSGIVIIRYPALAPPPSPYLDWAVANGLSGGEENTSAILHADGLTNLQKFAFGMDPNVSYGGSIEFDENGLITPGLPALQLPSNPATAENYRAVFVRRKDHLAAGLVYHVHFSVELNEWATNTAVPETMGDGGFQNVEAVYVPFPLIIQTTDGPKQPRFFRLSVSMD